MADDPFLLPLAIAEPLELGDIATARTKAQWAAGRLRTLGAVGGLPLVLQCLAFLDVWVGQLDLARIHAAEGLRLAEQTGQSNVALCNRGVLALIAATRGEEDDARAEASATLAGSIERGVELATGYATLALGELELALGRNADACERFERLAEPTMAAPFRLRSAADAIEAAVRSERHEWAAALLADLEAWTLTTMAPWALPLLARGRALVADGSDAEDQFAQALALHHAYSLPFDRARTELLVGGFLRRRRRRADARPHLRSAAETFASVGASIWATRARNELRATGETARHRDDPAAAWRLTPQESQIARLVAAGTTNREVAGELYLSTRTVDHHLRNVFAKLGISSRSELVRLPLDTAPADGRAAG